MLIHEAIDKIGLSVVAERMSTPEETVTPQRVNNWRSRGVPDDMVIEFCRAVDWLVTPHQIRPKNYPNRFDGLPEHVREAA